MATLPFNDLYISICENCEADLEDWKWLEDAMIFSTQCSCGEEYTLEPTMGVLTTCEHDSLDEEEDDDYDDYDN